MTSTALAIYALSITRGGLLRTLPLQLGPSATVEAVLAVDWTPGRHTKHNMFLAAYKAQDVSAS